jgi:nitroimidazol reductase NimA-like FMN-containing flavoprotein (pyridoxamine 5'-phosphate oxidase superfamily)
MQGAPVIATLSREECVDLLSRTRLGRIGVCVGSIPTILPVRFALSGDHVIFRVAPGSLLANVTANAIVTFEADRFDEDAREGWSVEVDGVMRDVEDHDAIVRCRALPLEIWADRPCEDRFLRLATAEVRGRRVRW